MRIAEVKGKLKSEDNQVPIDEGITYFYFFKQNSTQFIRRNLDVFKTSSYERRIDD